MVTEWIYFASADSLLAGLPAGAYDFQLGVTEIRPKGGRARDTTTDDADRRQLAVWDGHFTIDGSCSDFLRDHCVAVEGWAPGTCPVALTHGQRGAGGAIRQLKVST